MKIKNINGTAERFPEGYSSWQEFWEKKTGTCFSRLNSVCSLCMSSSKNGSPN